MSNVKSPQIHFRSTNRTNYGKSRLRTALNRRSPKIQPLGTHIKDGEEKKTRRGEAVPFFFFLYHFCVFFFFALKKINSEKQMGALVWNGTKGYFFFFWLFLKKNGRDCFCLPSLPFGGLPFRIFLFTPPFPPLAPFFFVIFVLCPPLLFNYLLFCCGNFFFLTCGFSSSQVFPLDRTSSPPLPPPRPSKQRGNEGGFLFFRSLKNNNKPTNNTHTRTQHTHTALPQKKE